MNDEKFYPIVVIELSAEEGGGFVGFAPDLKGCMSHGDTPEEALASTRDAVLEWIEEWQAMGREVPQPGAVAEATRSHRKRTQARIKQQSAAIEEMERNFRRIEEEISEIRSTLIGIDERLNGDPPIPAWMSGFISGVGSKNNSDPEDVCH